MMIVVWCKVFKIKKSAKDLGAQFKDVQYTIRNADKEYVTTQSQMNKGFDAFLDTFGKVILGCRGIGNDYVSFPRFSPIPPVYTMVDSDIRNCFIMFNNFLYDFENKMPDNLEKFTIPKSCMRERLLDSVLESARSFYADGFIQEYHLITKNYANYQAFVIYMI